MLPDVIFCFFKQKTAYEMRISDWSSDVCSSDLDEHVALRATLQRPEKFHHLGIAAHPVHRLAVHVTPGAKQEAGRLDHVKDRKSVVEGKSVSVRVDIGGRRIIKKKITTPVDVTNQNLKHTTHH